MSKKNWLFILIGIPVLFLLWYFAIKDRDYAIHFETKAIPGEIAYRLDVPRFDNLEVKNTAIEADFSKVVQDVKLGDESYDLNWIISKKNDSIYKVKVNVKNQNHSFKDRFLLLTGQNDFQKEMKEEIQFFKEALNANLKLYSVKIKGKTSSPENICACIDAESSVEQKAFEMMKTIDILSGYILNNELETRGRPRILIDSWDQTTKQISFNFCFPIAKMETYPSHPIIKIKNIPAEKTLEASFYGNYMLSHYAWLHLIDYAEKNNIAVKNEHILEVFQNNPQMGGDESQWQADIYLPIAE